MAADDAAEAEVDEVDAREARPESSRPLKKQRLDLEEAGGNVADDVADDQPRGAAAKARPEEEEEDEEGEEGEEEEEEEEEEDDDEEEEEDGDDDDEQVRSRRFQRALPLPDPQGMRRAGAAVNPATARDVEERQHGR